MTEIIQPIPARLKNVAVGGHVAGAADIIDETQQKDQETINSKLIQAVGTGGSVDSRIAAAVNVEKTRAEGAESTLTTNLGNEVTRATNAENALDGRVDTLEDAVGTGGSVDSRISAAVNAAKSEIKGNATSACDTLGEAEALISAETTRAQEAESNLNSGKADKATTLAGYGITDAYTKSETYNKTELHNLITTPNQGYVTAIADSNTTTANLKSLIDTAAGSDKKEKADFIYRVGCWDGSQYNDTMYSEYAWIDPDYVFLSKKSQIDEVFDISAYHANTPYVDLKAALGTNGQNIPQSLRKGGMSVKFIQGSVQSSDNKYVQYRLMSDTFNTTPANWQGVDEEPTIGSKNLVKSGGVHDAVQSVENEINGVEQDYFLGKYLDGNGDVQNDVDWFMSNKIPLQNGDSVTWNPGVSNNSRYLVVFSSSNVKLVAYQGSSASRTFTINEANAAYCIADFAVSNLANAEIIINGNKVWEPTHSESQRGLKDDILALQNEVNELNEKDYYPTENSASFVESEGIKYYVDGCNYEIGISFNQDGSIYKDENLASTYLISVKQGDSVEMKVNIVTENIGYIVRYNSQNEFVDYYSTLAATDGIRTISSIPLDGYIRVPFKSSIDAYVKINNEYVFQKYSKDGILPLRHDVEELKKSDNETISKNNVFKNSAIYGIASYIGFNYPNELKKKYLCLLHISDIHGDVDRFSRMVDFANEHTDIISGIIVTGDSNENDWLSNGFENTIGAYYDKTELPMLPVIGNHDMGTSNGLFNPPNTNEAVGQKFITPYMSRAGAVQGGVNAGYYYKDFSSFNIRLIVVNEYEMPRTLNEQETAYKYPMWARWISQEQTNWLINTLANTPNGYGVVIAMHQLIDNIDIFDNEFKCAIPYGSGDYYTGQRAFVDGVSKYIIQTIVDAYIDKGTINNLVFNGVITEGMPQVTVNADFSSAGGEFICYLSGHAHRDNTGKSSTSSNKQINVDVTNASINTSGHYDDLYRQVGKISEDVFNLIAFDTDRKEIRMLRIGANVSANMKRRDYACISYAQN